MWCEELFTEVTGEKRENQRCQEQEEGNGGVGLQIRCPFPDPAVAVSENGFDPSWTRRPQLRSQAPDVHIQGARPHALAVAPDRLQQELPGETPARILTELLQQGRLQPGQPN